MYARNAGGGEEIRVWWTGWVFHELSETPNKKEMSEERAEVRASKAGLCVGERTLSLAFAVKPSSSKLRHEPRDRWSEYTECWREDVLVDMPEYHEASDVLLAVEFTLGEVSSTLAFPDLFIDLRGSCPQYRASWLGRIGLCFGMVGGHGGW